MTRKEIFAKNLKHYTQIKGVDRNEICKALGVSYSTVTYWMNGEKFPRSEKLDELAGYLEISVSELVEAPEERVLLKALYEQQISNKITAPVIELDALDEEGQKMLMDYYNLLLMKYKKEIK